MVPRVFKYLCHVFCGVLVLMIFSCRNKTENIDARLSLSDSIMTNYPDSVLNKLQNIDPEELKSDYERSIRALYITIALDKSYQPLRPDSALSTAIEVFHRKGDSYNEIRARYYLGRSKLYVGDFQGAMWDAMNAIDLAHETGDTLWMGRTHDLAYEIHMGTYDARNAAIEADKAAVYFKKAGKENFHRYALYEKLTALTYPKNEKGIPVDDGDALLDSLLNVFKESNDSVMFAECLYYKVRKQFDSKDYDNCIMSVDTLTAYSDSRELYEWLLPYRITIKLNKGENVDSLMRDYNSIELLDKSDSMSFFSNSRNWMAMRGDWKGANQFADSLLQHYRKVLGDKSFKSVDVVKSDYKDEIAAAKQKDYDDMKSNYGRFFLCLGIVIIVSLVIAFYYKKKREILMSQLCDITSEKDVLTNYIFKNSVEHAEIIRTQNSQLDEVRQENEDLKSSVCQMEEIKQENEDLRNSLRQMEEVKRENEDLKSRVSLMNNIREENEDLKASVYKQLQVIFDNNECIKIYKAKMERIEAENIALKEKIERFNAEKKDPDKTHYINRSLLGNRLDTISNLVAKFYSENQEESGISKKAIYHNAKKEVKEIKSKKFLLGVVNEVEEKNGNILSRLKKQLPIVKESDLTWFAMLVAGVSPRAICFILEMKSQTLYSKRRRLREIIENSDCVDKEEFLIYLGK